MTSGGNGGAPLDESAFVVRGVSVPTETARVAAEQTNRLQTLRVEDVAWRVKTRPRIGWTIIGLLLAQNFFLVVGILWAAIAGDLPAAGPVIIGVTAATLGETAVIVRIVVTWLFSEIDYDSPAPAKPQQ